PCTTLLQYLLFFFQAQDGIRGFHVTGVQTCALPIYHHRIVVHPGADDDIAFAGWMVATQPALREVRERLLAAGVAVRQATPEEGSEERRVGRVCRFWGSPCRYRRIIEQRRRSELHYN